MNISRNLSFFIDFGVWFREAHVNFQPALGHIMKHPMNIHEWRLTPARSILPGSTNLWAQCPEIRRSVAYGVQWNPHHNYAYLEFVARMSNTVPPWLGITHTIFSMFSYILSHDIYVFFLFSDAYPSLFWIRPWSVAHGLLPARPFRHVALVESAWCRRAHWKMDIQATALYRNALRSYSFNWNYLKNIEKLWFWIWSVKE